MNKWVKEFPGGITICDLEGRILEINEKANKALAKEGQDLLGQNLLDCHPEKARRKLQDMFDNPLINSYTIEKKGVKKLIYQAPWYVDGEVKGYVEISLEIPFDLPHFIR